MVLVLTGFEVSAELGGEMKSSRRKVWELEADAGAADDDARFATARSQAVAMITQWKLITKANVKNMNIRAIYVENGALAIPLDAPLYDEAFLTLGIDVAGNDKGNHAIFAPADGIFSGDDETTGVIDETDPTLNTYLAFFAAPNFFRISKGNQMLSTPKILKTRLRSVGSGKTY
jgi:hypothetical protein